MERHGSTGQVSSAFTSEYNTGTIFPPSAKAARGGESLNTNTWYWVDAGSPFGNDDPTAWGVPGAVADKTMKLHKPIYNGMFDTTDVRHNKFDFVTEASLDVDTLWPGVFKYVNSLANSVLLSE